MSQESSQPGMTPVPTSKKAAPPSKPEETPVLVADKSPPPAAKSGKGSRIGAIIVLLLIVLSLAWYFVSDRLTPYTSQARVQAFVVPIAAEVAGTVLKVHVKNNDEVQRGQPLLTIDPTQYKIALQRSRSDYEAIRLSVGASTASVESAKAAVQAAIANNVFAQQDATRLEQIYKEDPGAISLRRVESAQSNRIKARSQVEAARADLVRA
jgi:multidrug resistance efflux pump